MSVRFGLMLEAYCRGAPSHMKSLQRQVSTSILSKNGFLFCLMYGRHGGLMVSAVDSGSNGLGSSPGQGHCVVVIVIVVLSKTLHSYSSSLHPEV